MLRALSVTRLGPGLLFAATAVGVSHLVQSTRAGASYGLIMAAYVVFICLLKYPTFLFGARYTAVTGESLVEGYGRQGPWPLLLLFVLQLLEYTFGIAGVAIVTAGLVRNVFDLGVGDVPLAVLLVSASLVLLAIGRYALLEDLTKGLVLAFSLCVLLAALLALVGIDAGERSLSAELTWDRPTLLFLVAVAGWMPIGTVAAVSISLWVKAKQARLGRNMSLAETHLDFNLGYFISMLIAVGFVVLGTYVLFIGGEQPVSDSAGFAAQLMGLFTATLGAWTYPLIAVAALAVMFSTLVTLVDLLPRTSAAILVRLLPAHTAGFGAGRLYLAFIGLELLLLLAVLFLLMDSFAAFIDLVTSMGFIVSPWIAWLNHRVMFSPHVPAVGRPSDLLRCWSLLTIVGLGLMGLGFVLLRWVL